MIYLSGVHSEALVEAAQVYPLGLMPQPGNGYAHQIHRYQCWAADNGCYAQGERFDPETWMRWLRGLEHQETCLFAVAPDVLYDAPATIRRSRPWLGRIRELGYPAALVGQDGAEHLELPWDEFDVLFLGGSTGWKLSLAAEVATEAESRGKPVHMGRVNSWVRLQAGVLMGCRSADGTFLKFRNRAKGSGRPEDRGLPELTHWLQELERAPFLPLRGENQR